MPGYPRMRDFPEALVKILLTIMEKTPDGGATMEDLKDAYQETRGSTPSNKTIYRSIRRLNLIFNPLAYGETPEKVECEDKDDIADDENDMEEFKPVIRSSRRKGKTRYLFNGELPTSSIDANNALLMALGLYSQQRGLLKGHFETAIREILRDMLARISAYNNVFREIERHIHVSGYGSANPGKNVTKIKEIMRAIHHRKIIRMEYLRSYDGTLTKREVEPYGLVCRLNNWYLIANCLQQQKKRVFLLDHTIRLEVVEASTFKWPEGFSLHDYYGNAWGVWTPDDEQGHIKETVRLKIAKGIAERFRLVSFHDSQQTEMLPDGEAMVTFTVKGASEMIPWLMSWGAAVEVLEPQWLRDAFVSNVEEVLGIYHK
ncbi:MAG: WYL domain-containing protein [Firmicutes bacterium]|nr:WYL domain-containing protein [Bacillota bacterium]